MKKDMLQMQASIFDKLQINSDVDDDNEMELESDMEKILKPTKPNKTENAKKVEIQKDDNKNNNNSGQISLNSTSRSKGSTKTMSHADEDDDDIISGSMASLNSSLSNSMNRLNRDFTDKLLPQDH